MPSKKTIAVFIVCGATVFSIWLFTRNPQTTTSALQNPLTTVEPSIKIPRQNIEDAQDWQEIINTSVLPQKNSANTINTGEGTLTDQMAKDFFGQYLSVQQKGQVTDEQAQQIAVNTLTSSQYTQATGAVYTRKNLYVNSQTNRELVKKYSDTLDQILTNRSPKKNQDAMSILKKAVDNQDLKILAELDPIIASEKAGIVDLLAVNIPSDAVNIHIALLNALSNLLANTESFRVTFSDPVKSFAAVSQYPQHILDTKSAIQNLETYFLKKQ